MHQVHERLHVGSETCCHASGEGTVVIHACKTPCHQRAVGYRGSLSPDHPHYLVWEEERDLYLNMIDPPQPLFRMEVFEAFMHFSVRHWKAGAELVIHCNQGQSRAPSLALLFLAAHLGEISDASYQEASSEFEQRCPNYRPGRGIQIFLEREWEQLMNLGAGPDDVPSR